MKKKVSLFLTALSCAVGAVAASEINSVQVAEVHGNVTAHKHRTDNNEYTRFRMGGYGEAVASFKDYGINRYYGNPNGNTRVHRNTISIPRFVLAMDYKFSPKWILSAEIEFEAEPEEPGLPWSWRTRKTANMKRKWKKGEKWPWSSFISPVLFIRLSMCGRDT